MAEPVDFSMYPWKHPAVWRAHIIKMGRITEAGEIVSVATCECGWHFSALLHKLGPERRDEAMHAHWKDVIDAASRSETESATVA